MPNEMKFEINIVDNEQINVFRLDEPYLKIEDLKRYFPNATGIIFEVDGKSFHIGAVDGKLKLHPSISHYRLLISEDENETLSLNNAIKKYFNLKYTYREMLYMLQLQGHSIYSVRKLRRILKKENLKRKNIQESSIEDIVASIIIEIDSSGMNIGYRAMHQRLKDKYRLIVKQKSTLKLMRMIDPEGIEKRSRYRLKRRRYSVSGPNYLWHLDGFDKMKRFGFAIHGCVDGFSRRVMWLEVATTNNNPEIIAFYYLQCIQELKFIPSIIRSDRGTENTRIDVLQIALRYYHDDRNAGANSFVKGKSTANERIEKFWRQLRHHTADYYIDIFKTLEAKKILDTTNILHIELLRYCFGPLIQHDLSIAMKEWNEHRIRQQKILNLPCGIPNIIYHWPRRYGGKDYRKVVDCKDTETLMENFSKKPVLFALETEELIKIIAPDVEVPCTSEKAYNLFVDLIQVIEEYEECID